jgi:hypothetical protein
LNRVLPRGKTERPDLAIIDDPEPDDGAGAAAIPEQQAKTDQALLAVQLIGGIKKIPCVLLGSLALCRRLEEKDWRVE